MSSRPDVFGVQFCAELEVLQDRVTPMPPHEVQSAMATSKLVGNLLQMDADPIASASIAQVHRATLKNGGVVAIKIARPGVLERIDMDVKHIKRLLYFLKLFHIIHSSDHTGLIDQFKYRLKREVDFEQELDHLVKFKQMYAHNPVVRVPNVFPELSTSKILVMEFLPAIKFDMIPSHERKPFATLLMSSFMLQILGGGLVHADPHAGNLGMHDTTRQIILYDFGNTIELSQDVINALKEAMLLVMEPRSQKNVDEIIHLFPRLGIHVVHNDPAYLRVFVSSYLEYIATLDVDTLLTSTAFSAPPPSGGSIPIVVNIELLSLLRILSILEGICKALNPDFNYMSIWPAILLQLSSDKQFVWNRVKKDLCALDPAIFSWWGLEV